MRQVLRKLCFLYSLLSFWGLSAADESGTQAVNDLLRSATTQNAHCVEIPGAASKTAKAAANLAGQVQEVDKNHIGVLALRFDRLTTGELVQELAKRKLEVADPQSFDRDLMIYLILYADQLGPLSKQYSLLQTQEDGPELVRLVSGSEKKSPQLVFSKNASEHLLTKAFIEALARKLQQEPTTFQGYSGAQLLIPFQNTFLEQLNGLLLEERQLKKLIEDQYHIKIESGETDKSLQFDRRELNLILSYFMNLPREVTSRWKLQSIRRARISPNEKDPTNPVIHAEYNPREESIVLYNLAFTDDNNFRRVLSHESGHAVWKAIEKEDQDFFTALSWRKVSDGPRPQYHPKERGEGFVSTYAMEDPGEDFAESYRTLLLDPNVLWGSARSADDPAKYRFIAERFFLKSSYSLETARRARFLVPTTQQAEVPPELDLETFKNASVSWKEMEWEKGKTSFFPKFEFKGLRAGTGLKEVQLRFRSTDRAALLDLHYRPGLGDLFWVTPGGDGYMKSIGLNDIRKFISGKKSYVLFEMMAESKGGLKSRFLFDESEKRMAFDLEGTLQLKKDRPRAETVSGDDLKIRPATAEEMKARHIEENGRVFKIDLPFEKLSFGAKDMQDPYIVLKPVNGQRIPGTNATQLSYLLHTDNSPDMFIRIPPEVETGKLRMEFMIVHVKADEAHECQTYHHVKFDPPRVIEVAASSEGAPEKIVLEPNQLKIRTEKPDGSASLGVVGQNGKGGDQNLIVEVPIKGGKDAKSTVKLKIRDPDFADENGKQRAGETRELSNGGEIVSEGDQRILRVVLELPPGTPPSTVENPHRLLSVQVSQSTGTYNLDPYEAEEIGGSDYNLQEMGIQRVFDISPGTGQNAVLNATK